MTLTTETKKLFRMSKIWSVLKQVIRACPEASKRFDSNQKVLLIQFCVLSQIFIVMPQVVLELRKKPFRKEKHSSVRSKG